MASGWYRATVTIPADTNIPADAVQSVWSFRHLIDGDHVVDGAEIASRLIAFYSVVAPSVASYLNIDATVIKIVDLQDDKPRLPFYEEVQTIIGASTSGTDFPAEVSLCLSFKAAPGSGLNPRRRRGRIYLPPMQFGAGDYGVPPSGFRAALVDAAIDELAITDNDVEWCVYSPYTHHGVPVGEKLDPEVYPEVVANLFDSFNVVSSVWMDDAWDTQRRRGPKATARYSADV